MAPYREFLPEPPAECGDPELFRLLNEYEFVRWHPDYGGRRDELNRQLGSEAILRRAEAGTSDASAEHRLYCGKLLIWAYREKGAPFTLKLLADPSEDVRGGIAQVLGLLRDDRCAGQLVQLARTDHSVFVRRSAATGLGGQDPLIAIPVLLELIDNDTETDESGHSPSSCAATALDEMMETEWTQQRHAADLRSLNPAGADLRALKDHARAFLRHCQQAKGQLE